MAERYIDADGRLREIPTFIKRRHGFPLWWLAVSFLLAFAAIVSVVYLNIPEALFPVSAVTAITLTALIYFTSVYIHNSRDIIMATEFQNALFAGAARAHSAFFLIVKRDGSLVYADKRYNTFFSQETGQGLHGLDILLAQPLPDEVKKRLSYAVSTNATDTIPFSYRDAQGKIISLFLHIDPIYFRDSTNEEKESIVTEYTCIRAVSAEKRPHDYEAIISQLAAGFYLADANGYFTYVNESLAHFLGYEPEEITNTIALEKIIRPFGTQSPPPSLRGNYRGAVKLLTTKEGLKHAMLMQTIIPSEAGVVYCGVITPFANTMAPASGENGLTDGWRCFIEHSPIAVAQLDEKGNILRSNKAFLHLKEKVHQGNKHNLLAILDNGQEHVEHLLQTVANAPVHDEKPVDIVLAGENRVTASVYLSRMENADGSTAGILAYVIDTTEQKNLELRVVHSQKMQAVGQLAGGIAHDFNNLLTAMMGFCDLLLLRHPAGDPSFADIMQIKQNANRAANLVRQLLAFSRKQTLQPEVLDLTDVLAELSNLVRRLIGENIELKINHGRDLGLIKVDQGQLEQVLINLAVNARDAMLEGGTLTIQTSNIKVDRTHPISRDLIAAESETIEDGDYVLVEVIDTGHGIPKDIIGKIFEPFFSTKEMGSGTGLGLATVYGIIKQTGGYVYVSSKENLGTTFSIFLKSYRSSEPAKSRVKEEEMAERLAAASDLTGKGIILLVEDEAPVRIFSAQALSNKGYTILEADCGEKALEIVNERGNEIDLIITDVVMPGMNGPSMVEAINKQYPNVKVIFISGYAEDAFLKTYGTERKFNFLPKPFTLKQLAGKVKEVIEKEAA